MVLLTVVARVTDGLPLAASMEDEQVEAQLAEYKNQAKAIFKTLSSQAESKMFIESKNRIFCVYVELGVAYLCLCERTFPRAVAVKYLEDLQREFNARYGDEVANASRPYQFVAFDTVIQSTKRQYTDARSQPGRGTPQAQPLSKVNEELNSVTRIMTTNIQDLLGRGERLDRMTELSGTLSMESRKYMNSAKNLNLQLLYRKYGPPAVVALVILLVLFIRFYWF